VLKNNKTTPLNHVTVSHAITLCHPPGLQADGRNLMHARGCPG